MQCPFLIENDPPLCETGTFGMIQARTRDYKKFCSGRSFHLCQVYRANTGYGDPIQCKEDISARLIQV